MEVILRKSVIDQIRDARRSAERNGREIEKIVLTPTEARKLFDQLGVCRPILNSPISWYSDFEMWLIGVEAGCRCLPPQPKLRVMGVDIEVKVS
jgi:hypothetical protein